MTMSIAMRAGLLLVALGLSAAPALAQAPPPAAPPAAPAAATPPPQSQPAPAPTETYTYDPEGRRDPFVSLLLRGAELTTNRENRPDGREGLMIGEVTLRGIVKNRTSYVAMVQGPDNKTYIIHTGDKMLDGAVRAITADAVVFAQDVNDPLSLVKQREVRKLLRTPEEGK
jgi:type IV pilus assembly protein PilP